MHASAATVPTHPRPTHPGRVTPTASARPSAPRGGVPRAAAVAGALLAAVAALAWVGARRARRTLMAARRTAGVREGATALDVPTLVADGGASGGRLVMRHLAAGAAGDGPAGDGPAGDGPAHPTRRPSARGPRGRPHDVLQRVPRLVPRATPPPVVLVHGYGVGGRYFLPLVAALRRAGAGAVLVPELVGHGGSPAAPRPLDVPAHARALDAWLRARGVGRALFVGQSMGAQVVAELAHAAPARVAGAVLVGPTPDPGVAGRAPSVRAQLWRAARTAPFESLALLALVAADYLRAGPRLVTAELAHLARHDAEGALRALGALAARGVPVRVVRGAHDHVAPERWCARVAALAGAPAPVCVRGHAHAVHFDAPAAVAAVVRDAATAMMRPT